MLASTALALTGTPAMRVSMPAVSIRHFRMLEEASLSEVEALKSEVARLQQAAGIAEDNLRVAVAACGAAELREKLLQKENAKLKLELVEDESVAEDDRVAKAFDAVDDNGDGVLDIDEFRKGYALLTGDAVAAAFEAIDDNGDGVLTKEEFKRGFALLTSDSAKAAAERERIEAAVESERVRAVKQAAKNLAEAQLMDTLYGEPEQYKFVKGRKPLPRRRSQEGAAAGAAAAASVPYAQYGPLPKGFDAEAARDLVNARVTAKETRDFTQADALQQELLSMGVRLDDRWRTWSVPAALDLAKAEYEKQQREDAKLRAKSPRGAVTPTKSKSALSNKGAVAKSALQARARVNRAVGAVDSAGAPK